MPRAAVMSAPAFVISLACAFLPISCDLPENGVAAVILSPGDGASVEAGTTICFRANLDDAGFAWISDLDGELGRGGSVLRALSEGTHRVSLKRDGTLLDAIEVVAFLPEWTPGGGRTRLLAPGSASLYLPAGNYRPFAVSFSPIAYAVFRWSADGGAKEASRDSGGEGWLARDACPRFFPAYSAADLRDAPDLASRRSREYAIGDTRTFRMADCARGTGVPGFEIEATLLTRGDGFDFWVDDASPVAPDLVDSLWNRMMSVSLPKARAIWGTPVAPVAPGPVTILASDKLNKARIALGFFNPADYWPYDGDTGSVGYNPTSNDGMTILYLAVPDVADPAFGVDSLAATACHEYQHMVAFSKVTWREWSRGNPSPPFVAPWLAEAQAHLTESLCGLGESGGNYDFFMRYAEAPWRYSIGSTDADGSNDSAGKRGAAAAFLYWLYARAEAALPGGGKAFLEALVEGKVTDWEGIGPLLAGSTDSLFRAWVREIAERATGYLVDPVFDPDTGQRIDLGFFAGTVTSLSGEPLSVGGPATPGGSWVTLPPRAAVWFAPLESGAPSLASIECSRGDGRAVLVFAMR